MSVNDKNNIPIHSGDIVLLEVYEPILKHAGITTILGKVVWVDTTYDRYISIDIGVNYLRRRRGSDIEIAYGFEQEFEDQVKSHEPYLMLATLEKYI